MNFFLTIPDKKKPNRSAYNKWRAVLG